VFSVCIGAANARAGLPTRNIPLKFKISFAKTELRHATDT